MPEDHCNDQYDDTYSSSSDSFEDDDGSWADLGEVFFILSPIKLAMQCRSGAHDGC